MATGGEVLSMLIPTGGWVIIGDKYEDIQFNECQPITKSQFEAGFAKVEDYKAKKETELLAAKQVILDKLGITAEEAAALLA